MPRPSILAALIALVSLMAVPSGFMPMRAADGGYVLQLCSGVKDVPAPGTAPDHAGMAGMDMGPGASHDGDHGKMKQVSCDYAMSALGHAPDPPVFAAPAPALPPMHAALGRRTLTGLFPPHLPPATGPPRS